MRRVTALTILLLAAAAAPAGGESQTVGIQNNAFAPASVTIEAGDSVTWCWNGPDTNHSVTSAADSPEQFDSDAGRPTALINHPQGFTFTYTFARPGTFNYFCRVHPSTMTGRVVVQAEGSPPPAEDRTRPVVTGLSARPALFCKRHRRCRRPGTVLRFTLSEAADVRAQAIGRERDGDRVVKTFVLGRGRAGANRVRFHPSRLDEGLYLLRLTATDDAGNTSRTARVRFRIVPPPPPPRKRSSN